MERLIVNEGQGPVPRDLTAAHTSVGGAPDCDVVLRHPSAQGSTFVIERTTHGHHVRVVSGMLFHNEEACTAADLLHNDTLRVGETLVLYKNPAATLPAAGPAIAAPQAQLAPPTFEELAVLEELEPLEELQPLDEPIEVEALEPLEELAELEELEALEVLDVLEPAEALEPTALPAAPAPSQAPKAREPRGLPAMTKLPEPMPELEALPVASPEAAAAATTDAATIVADRAMPIMAATASAATTSAATGAETAVPVAAVRAPLRPADGIRFRRPLPPGRRGPTSLPPAHPGRPPQ